MIEQKFSLELTKNGVQKTIYAKQGEKNARTLSISLTCNGRVANISEYTIDVMYDMFNAQGQQYKVSIENEGNPIEFKIPDYACVNADERIFEIRFKKGTDIIFSPQFRVIVEANLTSSGGEATTPSVDSYVVARTGYDLVKITDAAKIPTLETSVNTLSTSVGTLSTSVVTLTTKVNSLDEEMDSKADSDTMYSELASKADAWSLSTVATSGSYSDLSNKPTIPTVPTNVSSFTNDAGYLTSHQDISGKQDTLVSGTNIKTINNESILGSGNITIQGGGPSDPIEMATDTTEETYELNKTINEYYADWGNGKKLTYMGNEVFAFTYDADNDAYNVAFHLAELNDSGELVSIKISSRNSWTDDTNVYDDTAINYDFTKYLDVDSIVDSISGSATTSVPNVGAVKNYVDSQISAVLNTSFGGDA